MLEVTFLQYRFDMFHGIFRVKCPVSGTKMHVPYATHEMTDLCYADTGTCCCVSSGTTVAVQKPSPVSVAKS